MHWSYAKSNQQFHFHSNSECHLICFFGSYSYCHCYWLLTTELFSVCCHQSCCHQLQVVEHRQLLWCFRINENYELLVTRRQMILNSKEGLEFDVKEQTAVNRAHVANMNSLKPELKRLQKLRETYKKWAFGCFVVWAFFCYSILPCLYVAWIVAL